MENIHEEAVLGILSEINSKVDTVISVVKANQQAQQPVETINQPAITKEEVELILQSHGNHLGKFIETTHNQEVEFYNKLITAIFDLKKRIQSLPPQKEISLEPILSLLPKEKKISLLGVEFLRTSVIIFALVLLSFCSLTLNIKQSDDYHLLKKQYGVQNEYIQLLEKDRNEKMEETKPETKKSKK